MSETEDQVDFGLFEEPSNFRPKTPEATFAYYSPPPDRLPSSSRVQLQPSHAQEKSKSDAGAIKLKLVGFSALWGHHLWNAAPVLSDYILLYRDLLLPQASTCVLELGAASGLPSIVAAKALDVLDDVKGKGKGKATVVSTDYPDPDLITNLRENLLENGILYDGAEDASIRNAVAEVSTDSPTLQATLHADGHLSTGLHLGL
jgi:predicted nicotinamide N-methyase